MNNLQNKRKNKCCQGRRETGTFKHCWWEYKWFRYYGKLFGSFSRKLNRITIWPSNSTSRYILPQNWNHGLRYLCVHVHSSVVHNNQKVERNQMSINGLMDKQIVVYPYNRIHYSAIKWLTCYNMDEPQKHAKWRKPDTKGHIFYDSIYKIYPESVN